MSYSMTHCQVIDQYITMKDFLCFPRISSTSHFRNCSLDRELDSNKNRRVSLVDHGTYGTLDHVHTLLLNKEKSLNLIYEQYDNNTKRVLFSLTKQVPTTNYIFLRLE